MRCRVPAVSFGLGKDVVQNNQLNCEPTHSAKTSAHINPATTRQGSKPHTVQSSLTMSRLPFMHHSPLGARCTVTADDGAEPLKSTHLRVKCIRSHIYQPTQHDGQVFMSSVWATCEWSHLIWHQDIWGKTLTFRERESTAAVSHWQRHKHQLPAGLSHIKFFCKKVPTDTRNLGAGTNIGS